MAADVAAHYLAPGMSRQAVTALLGPFDTASGRYDSTLFQLPPVIGYQVWQGDSEKNYLYLEFTQQGKLATCWVETQGSYLLFATLAPPAAGKAETETRDFKKAPT
jgi:hypothetical protein